MHARNMVIMRLSACPQKLRGREEEMAWQDKKQRLTNEAKNALEAYIYDFRNKLADQLAAFVTEDHKGNLTVKLEQTEVGALVSCVLSTATCG